MRFITRTLPWVVILIVIAFFIGLKQSSNRSISSTASKKSDVKSEASVDKPDKSDSSKASADQPEAVILIEESTVTEEPGESEPNSNDGDLIDLKLFEGSVEKEDFNKPTKASKTEATVEEPTGSSSLKSSKPTEKDSSKADVTSMIDSPILLSMNPPVLRQPISIQSSDSKGHSSEGWEWSEAVGQVQSESSDSVSDSSPSAESQGEMPTMYGPAEEGVTLNEEGVTDADDDDADDDADDACDEDAMSDEEADQPAEPSSKQEVAPRKPLSPEMQKLRDAVRQTINAYSKPILNTRDNTVAQLLDVCEAFGCGAEVMYVDQKRKINAFANLCYNYPCAGYKPLKLSDGRIEPRLGYGFQATPGQMLAVMALGRVPESYPIQFNEKNTGTVADLVQREKETCRAGEDLSFKLIGIIRYTPSGETWKSESGQTWSVERLLSEVLKQPAQIDNVAGTNRLMALSYAVDRRTRRNEPIDGPYAKAAKYIVEFQDYALAMINSDGTWHPRFFLSKGTGSPNQGRLQSTGHILRWLAFSLPEERLQDPRVIQAIVQVHRSLGGNARNGLASSSPQSIDSRLTAVHALVLYNNRLFKPHDAVNEEVEVVKTVRNEKIIVK